MKYKILSLAMLLFGIVTYFAQTNAELNPENLPVREYHLTINKHQMNVTGKTVEAMAVNGSIP